MRAELEPSRAWVEPSSSFSTGSDESQARLELGSRLYRARACGSRLARARLVDSPIRLEAHFLENFCQKSQVLNKYKKPADRPAQGSGLSARHLKTNFSYDFQWNPFTKRNRHSSKCNACKFLIQVALWKVKPMKLIPLDSTTIYPINMVI
jgi:hypothetical protein